MIQNSTKTGHRERLSDQIIGASKRAMKQEIGPERMYQIHAFQTTVRKPKQGENGQT